MDRVETLIKKLNASGIEKVKENLKHKLYTPWKIPYIEEWLLKQETPSNMFHIAYAFLKKEWKWVLGFIVTIAGLIITFLKP